MESAGVGEGVGEQVGDGDGSRVLEVIDVSDGEAIETGEADGETGTQEVKRNEKTSARQKNERRIEPSISNLSLVKSPPTEGIL